MPVGSAHIQYGDHYPLVDPSPDIQFVLADMTVSCENPKFEYDLPLQITYIDPNGGLTLTTWEQKLKLLDTQTETVEHTQQTVGDYVIHGWKKEGVIVKAVINSRILTAAVQPEHAVLDLRTTVCVPPRVRAVSVKTENGIVPCQPNILIAAGHNLKLTGTAREKFRSANVLHVDAIAGAGLGTVEEECTETAAPGLKRICGVAPDENGAFYLTTENGITSGVDCAVISLDGTNRACCTCDDMAAFGQYINRVTRDYHKLGAKAVWLRNQHNQMVQTWNELPPASTAIVSSNTNAIPLECPFFQVRVAVTNTSRKTADFIKVYGLAEILSAETQDANHSLTAAEEILQQCSLKLVSQTISNYEYETTPVPEQHETYLKNADGSTSKVTTIKLQVLKGANLKFRDVRDENVYAVWSQYYDPCYTVSPLQPDIASTELERVTKANEELELDGSQKSEQLFEHWYSSTPYMEWYCVPAGSTVYWTGIYRLMLPERETTVDAGGNSESETEWPAYVYQVFAEKYKLQFSLKGGHIDLHQDADIPLSHRMLGGLYLTGSRYVTLTMHCDQTPDDVLDGVPKREDAEKIREKIYDLKKEYWPCPEKESENA